MKKTYSTAFGKTPVFRNPKKTAFMIALAFCIAVVPLTATLSLRTAMTEEIELGCGIGEHIHFEDCYEKVLECELPEIEGKVEHCHNEECYEPGGDFVCELAENHIHTKDCYQIIIICEYEEHIHDEGCLNISDKNSSEKVREKAAVSSFSSGSGTENDPYIITTAEELAWLAEIVTEGDPGYSAFNGPGKHFKLGNDIDLSAYGKGFFNPGGEGWAPIGDGIIAEYSFRGVFDGDGNKITGLYIDRTDFTQFSSYSALFGNTSGATIKNLGVVGADIRGYTTPAGIIASMSNASTLENCYVTGSIIGYGSAGGLVGVLNMSRDAPNVINKCYTTASVTAERYIAGGIAGNCRSNAVISNCYSTGMVTNILSSDVTQAAGILGNAEQYSSVEIQKCYATGNIISDDIAGGIVTSDKISECLVENSVALSLEISGNSISRRIAGGFISAPFINNRAYDQIKKVDGDTNWTPGGTLTNLNGLDMTADEALTASFWTESMKWDGDHVWLFRDGKLPVLRGLDGQSGAPHFDGFEEEPIAIAKIDCEKIVIGHGAPNNKEFTFTLTEVDEYGAEVSPLFEMEMIIEGGGEFLFDVPVYEIGTHYYRISEKVPDRDGWIYDDSVYIVEVNVAGDANNTVTTSLENSEIYFKVTFSPPASIHAKPDPPLVFDITPGKRYSYVGKGFMDFRLSDGSKQYFGFCGNYSGLLPTINGQIYQRPYGSGEADQHMALAAALGVSATGGYQNGTGLTDSEYAGLFGVETPPVDFRRSCMQSLIWNYENKTSETPDFSSHLRDVVNDMVRASNNTPEGQGITSLALAYDSVTGQLEFSHEGYQPIEYDTWLTWKGDTNGLVVLLNGQVRSSGIKVKKEDTVIINYTGTGTVDFSLNDYQLYLKAGSIEGAFLENLSDSRVQTCLVGSAEFVNLQRSMKLSRYPTIITINSLVFVNEFKTLFPASAEIVGGKTITGVDTTNEEFTFRLTQVTDMCGSTPVSPSYTDSTSVNGEGAFSFSLSGLYPGVHYYRINEYATTPSDGWTYEKRPRVVRVDVSDDYIPVATITYPHKGLIFNNTYKRPGGVSAFIECEKQISGVSETDQVFAYNLVQVADITGEVPYTEGMPHMDSKVTNGAGTFRFELHDLFPGTYFYKISEMVDTSDVSWDYDDSEYIVVVTVSDGVPSYYEVSFAYYKNEAVADGIIFNNAYTSPPSTEAVIEGVKEVNGSPDTDKEFEFMLHRVTDETGSELFLPLYSKVESTTGAGDFSFTIPELLPGVYYYRVSEDDGEADWKWKYDPSVYVVTVTVSEELDVNVSYPGEMTELRFVNKFVAGELLPKTGGIGMGPFLLIVLMLAAILSVFVPRTIKYRCQTRR